MNFKPKYIVTVGNKDGNQVLFPMDSWSKAVQLARELQIEEKLANRGHHVGIVCEGWK